MVWGYCIGRHRGTGDDVVAWEKGARVHIAGIDIGACGDIPRPVCQDCWQEPMEKFGWLGWNAMGLGVAGRAVDA